MCNRLKRKMTSSLSKKLDFVLVQFNVHGEIWQITVHILQHWVSGVQVQRLWEVRNHFYTRYYPSFSCCYATCYTFFSQVSAPSKWANQRLLLIYTCRRFSPFTISAVHYWIANHVIPAFADSSKMIGSASWYTAATYAASKTNEELPRDTLWSPWPSVMRQLLWVTHNLKLMTRCEIFLGVSLFIH